MEVLDPHLLGVQEDGVDPIGVQTELHLWQRGEVLIGHAPNLGLLVRVVVTTCRLRSKFLGGEPVEDVHVEEATLVIDRIGSDAGADEVTGVGVHDHVREEEVVVVVDHLVVAQPE